MWWSPYLQVSSCVTRQHAVCAPVTLRLSLLDRLPNLLQLVLAQRYVCRPPILLQSAGVFRSRNGHGPLRRDPGDTELPWRASLLLGQSFKLVHDAQVVLEVLGKSWGLTPDVVGKLRSVLELAGEDPFAEGRVRHDCHAVLASNFDEVITLVVDEPWRVLDLQRVDMGNCC